MTAGWAQTTSALKPVWTFLVGYPRRSSSAPCKPPRRRPLTDRAVGRAWRRCGLRVGARFAQDELHAQDPEQFQEPPGADYAIQAVLQGPGHSYPRNIR